MQAAFLSRTETDENAALAGRRRSGRLVLKGNIASIFRTRQALLEAPDELLKGNTNCLAVVAELDEVEAAFSAFVVADARVGRVEALGESGLRQAGILAGMAQEFLEVLLLGAVNAFSHSSIICATMPMSEVQTEAGRLPAREDLHARLLLPALRSDLSRTHSPDQR
jgi:hypothetical protein